VGGFKGTVSLTCGGAPTLTTCSISPTQVTLDGINPAIASVTLTTTAHSSFPPIAPRFVPLLPTPKLLVSLLAYLFICVVLCRLARIPRKRLLLTAAVALPLALLCASCGGSTSSSSSSTTTNPPPTQQGTPQGAFTITVTGTSANLSHTTNVMLKVN
jgi:MFS-type transporter involved in bile tolerance (Atg22 family)